MDLLLFVTLPATRNPQLVIVGAIASLTGRTDKKQEKHIMHKIHILITGLPGSGKTTLFKRLLDALRNLNPTGFYTSEIREGGTRKGFRLKSLDGRSGVLAHVGFQTGYRVGKYAVDLEGFEAFLRPFVLLSRGSTGV